MYRVKRCIVLVAIISITLLQSEKATCQQSIFQLLSDRVRDDVFAQSEQGLDKLMLKKLQTITSSESWNEVNYLKPEGDKLWAPTAHLRNVQFMAMAYISPSSVYRGDSVLYKNIVTALFFWNQLDPICPNWWDNEISHPQIIGQILILMKYGKSPLPITLTESLIAKMKRGNVFKQTGANKLDIALHQVYRAILTQNKSLLDTAISQAFEPICYTTKEGLQYDNSYMQHGPQLQISSYGSVFISGEFRVASYVEGTSFALDSSKKKLLFDYYRNTFLKAIRGRYSDFNVEGRGVSRPNVLDKIAEAKRLRMAMFIDPNHLAIYKSALDRITELTRPDDGIERLHTHYWNSDYTLHIRKDYSFNVRMVSNRTKRTESGNSENIYGKYMPDGSTNIQRSGAEYFNIMPIWEWDKIPGITARNYPVDRPTTIQWGETGSGSFTGGVSDSVYGISAYALNYDSVKANKAWFFFDEEVVCLGAGISSAVVEPINSTLNQCMLNGPVTMKTAQGIQKLAVNTPSFQSNQLQWVLHDSIGYFFPMAGNIHISNTEQQGSWNHINLTKSSVMVKHPVFKMWVDHGVHPQGEQYAYIVSPAKANVAAMNAYPIENIVILANTDTIQAVKQSALNMLAIVFYKPGSITDHQISVSVNKPCIVLLKQLETETPLLYVCDPTQNENSIELAIQMPKLNGVQKIKINLPSYPQAGSSVRYDIKTNLN